MRAIYSDDPQAIDKLKQKLEALQKHQAHMKEINIGFRKHGMAWVKTQVTPETFRFYQPENVYSYNRGRFYPQWALSNNNAVIRATKKRIADLINKKNIEA